MNEPWRINLKDPDGGSREIENEGELDEVVIAQWFHLEKMTDHTWWIRIGSHCVSVDLSTPLPVFDIELDRY